MPSDVQSEVHLKPGDILFREADETEELYVLLDGAVEVLLEGVCVATIDEPGAFLGEMSALLGTPRSATVRAVQPSVCMRYGGDLDETFFAEPALSAKLARTLARRLHETNINLREIRGMFM